MYLVIILTRKGYFCSYLEHTKPVKISISNRRYVVLKWKSKKKLGPFIYLGRAEAKWCTKKSCYIPENTKYFTTGAGALGEAPLLARGPRTYPVLRRPRNVPLHQRCRAPLRAHNVCRHLLDGGQVDDDGAVDEGDDHHHAEHDGEEHAEAEPFLTALWRQLRLRHFFKWFLFRKMRECGGDGMTRLKSRWVHWENTRV